MSMIEVQELTKKFGDFTAVDRVGFTVDEGEIYGFLGPNGAGKTTTINMMIGLARPTSGSISVAGMDAVRNVKASQAVMGVVPDESNMYDELSGFDNLCFSASLYGMPKKEREPRARMLLADFDLEKAGQRRFKAYSKGMRRKLTIAAGIIHQPKVLFLDEPTTGIDVESARQIRDLVLGLKAAGTTVFMTTHYLEDAERICDRISFIAGGKIVKTDTVAALLQSIKTSHTVRFVTDSGVEAVVPKLRESFPDFRFESAKGALMVKAAERFPLLPIIGALDTLGYRVYDAREVEATLEDAFVRLTGTGDRK